MEAVFILPTCDELMMRMADKSCHTWLNSNKLDSELGVAAHLLSITTVPKHGQVNNLVVVTCTDCALSYIISSVMTM